MKKKCIIFVSVLILLMLTSCGKQFSSRIKSAEIEDLNFGNKFSNPHIVNLRVQVYNSKVFNLEGDLYNQCQVYTFLMDENKINYIRINEIELSEIEYFTLDEVKTILSDVNTFLKDEFQLSSYNIRLFSSGHNISVLDEDFLVYEYFNENFYITTDVSQVRTACLLIYGNDKAMIILLN